MERLLWPLAVVVAFGLGLAASNLSRVTGPSSPAGETSQATVRRLQMQVSTLARRS